MDYFVGDDMVNSSREAQSQIAYAAADMYYRAAISKRPGDAFVRSFHVTRLMRSRQRRREYHQHLSGRERLGQPREVG